MGCVSPSCSLPYRGPAISCILQAQEWPGLSTFCPISVQ